MSEDFKVVYFGNGLLDAQTIKIFLEASGIPAFIIQQGANSGYALTVGALGEVWVCVTNDHEAAARELLEKMQDGELESDENLTADNFDDPELDRE
jgi:hypothetical protein